MSARSRHMVLLVYVMEKLTHMDRRPHRRCQIPERLDVGAARKALDNSKVVKADSLEQLKEVRNNNSKRSLVEDIAKMLGSVLYQVAVTHSRRGSYAGGRRGGELRPRVRVRRAVRVVHREERVDLERQRAAPRQLALLDLQDGLVEDPRRSHRFAKGSTWRGATARPLRGGGYRDKRLSWLEDAAGPFPQRPFPSVLGRYVTRFPA